MRTRRRSPTNGILVSRVVETIHEKLPSKLKTTSSCGGSSTADDAAAAAAATNDDSNLRGSKKRNSVDRSRARNSDKLLRKSTANRPPVRTKSGPMKKTSKSSHPESTDGAPVKKRASVRRTRSGPVENSSKIRREESRGGGPIDKSRTGTASSGPIEKSGILLRRPPVGTTGGWPSKKRVHWNTRVSKRRHIQLKDMTAEEKYSVWYSSQDSKLILAMAKVTVKMMMRGEPCDDDTDYCSRGLEGKTREGSKKRNKSKVMVNTAVLMEQEIQRMDKKDDPETIAKASFNCSEVLCRRARLQGTQDERDVGDFLDDVRIDREDFVKQLKSLSRNTFVTLD